jgi:hypothetical protein
MSKPVTEIYKKCSDKFFGIKLDMKLIIIVVVLLLVFFMFVYPQFKKEHSNGLIGKFMDFSMGRSERFSLGNVKEHSETLGKVVNAFLGKDKEKFNLTAGADALLDATLRSKKNERFNVAEETYNNLSAMTNQELRVYMASIDNTIKKTLISELGPERVAKLNEKMGGNILYVQEGMADYVPPDQISATGNLKPVASNDIEKFKIENMMCSKSCCSPQWGVKQHEDDRIQANDLGTKYMPTNYMCSGDNVGDHGNGCVCIDKDTFSYLGNRGGNNFDQ